MSVSLVVLLRVVQYQLPSECVSLASGFIQGGSISVTKGPAELVGL